MGFAGTAKDIITVAEYFSYPESFEELPKVEGITGLVLTEKKEIYIFDSYTHWIKVEASHHAIGTGGQVANGAMASGKSPTEAVKIAMKHDTYTGFGVKTFKL